MSLTKSRVFWIVLACAAALVIALFRFGTPTPPAAEQTRASEAAYEAEGWQEQLRDRTLKQGESGRIYP